jgi:hypothetical protein
MSGASCLPFASDGWLTLTTKLADRRLISPPDRYGCAGDRIAQSQGFFKQKEPELATARC